MKCFLLVTSDFKADMLPTADILSSIPQMNKRTCQILFDIGHFLTFNFSVHAMELNALDIFKKLTEYKPNLTFLL
jgi:hypothetical protein